MKNNTDKDIEKLLLNDDNFEKALKSKIENDFKQELENKKSVSDKYITDIKSVPADKIFSRNAIFEVINRNSKTRSYINGVQAEGYLGAKASDRTKLLNRETDSFVCGDCFVKFIKLKV